MSIIKNNKRLSFKEYQKYAPTTRAELKIEVLDGSHLALGMFTELGELQTAIDISLYGNPEDIDITNIKEEIGDYIWYVACLCDILKYDMESMSAASMVEIPIAKKDDLQKTWSQLIIYTSEVADAYKKLLAYKKPINYNKLYNYLIAIIKIIDKNLCPYYKLETQNVMYYNIAKLSSRYPDKFRAFNAIHRDIEKERKILED